MTTRPPACLALSILLLAGAALAQDAPPAPLIDDWDAKWVARQKAAWSNVRIERAGDGLVLVRSVWTVVGEGRVVVEESRTETDGAGKILRHSSASRGPWGDTTVAVKPDGEGLTYTVQIRTLPKVEGRVQGDVFSARVVAHLVMTGTQPPGKRALRLLALPGQGAYDGELEVIREGETWLYRTSTWLGWYDAAGRFLRSEGAKDATLHWWRAEPSEAAAKELAAAPPPGAPAATATVVEAPGVRLTRPAGPGWTVEGGDQNGARKLALKHASGVEAEAMCMPMRLATDEAGRLAFAESMRQGLNGRGEEELGPPEAATWRGRPAVRFDLSGSRGGVPWSGEAFLVDQGGRTLAWMVAGPRDLAEACAAERKSADAAIELVAASAEVWERVKVPGATLELPRGWCEGDGVFVSPLGASRVQGGLGPIPPGVELEKVQGAWLAQQQRNPGIAEFEVVREEEVELDGRRVRVAEWRGRLTQPADLRPRVRSASCLAMFEDGTYREIVIIGIDMDFELEALDRVLKSVRWEPRSE